MYSMSDFMATIEARQQQVKELRRQITGTFLRDSAEVINPNSLLFFDAIQKDQASDFRGLGRGYKDAWTTAVNELAGYAVLAMNQVKFRQSAQIVSTGIDILDQLGSYIRIASDKSNPRIIDIYPTVSVRPSETMAGHMIEAFAEKELHPTFVITDEEAKAFGLLLGAMGVEGIINPSMAAAEKTSQHSSGKTSPNNIPSQQEMNDAGRDEAGLDMSGPLRRTPIDGVFVRYTREKPRLNNSNYKAASFVIRPS